MDGLDAGVHGGLVLRVGEVVREGAVGVEELAAADVSAKGGQNLGGGGRNVGLRGSGGGVEVWGEGLGVG